MLIKQDFNYTPKNQMRTLHIYLPDDYNESNERYPVMYFFDGHNLFRDEDATYGTCWGFETFLSTWRKKLIIVGIECTHVGNERLGEYSPYSFGNDYWGHVTALGKETMDWIVDEIKPMIDSKYRTWPFRECTAIGGSSMGGLMALYAGIRYNTWFSKLICVSSALGFSYNDVIHDVETCSIDPDTRFFMSWGSEEAGGGNYQESEMTRRNHAVAQVLKHHHAMVSMYLQVGGHHCEADWAKQVPMFMDYMWF